MKNKFNLLFFFTGLLFGIFLIQFTYLNKDGNIPLYIFIYFETFLLYLLAVYLIWKNVVSFSLPEKFTSLISKLLKIKDNLSLPLVIILTGIVFRLILFPAALTTSPDAYRYVWEGKVIINGYNPYEYEPSSPELIHLHSADLPSKIHYNEKKAIYPPAAQLIFTVAYFISGEELWGLKLLYLIFEILTMLFLMKLLILKKKNPAYVIFYAWLPLSLMEYFVNAHLDVFGISFFIISVYLFEKEKYFGATVLLAFSVLSKFFPIFILPLLIKKAGIRRAVFMGLLILLISVLFYLPFISFNTNIFSMLMLYLEKWEFNASVYYLLKLFMSNESARILCMLMFLLSVGLIAYRYRDFTKGVLWVMTAFIIFATTVYPWYLGWIAVLNPVYNLYSVMSLLFTSNLSNLTPMSPVWTEYTYVLLAEYGVFFILMGFDLRRQLKGVL